jgi:hypothetical protein
MDAFLERLCSVFNFFEALFWIGIAAGFGVTYWRKRQNGDLMLAAGLLFFEFGLSDFVEMQTGAWYRPWWLCAWKTTTVIALLALFVLFRRRRSVATTTVSSSAPVPRSRLIGWITVLWRGGCAAVVVSACVLLFVPVARISPQSCDRIRPGMTVAEAEEIVGAPVGWYDGVEQLRLDGPGWRGDKPYWSGSRGQLVLDVDQDGRVLKAAFYPGKPVRWSLIHLATGRLIIRWIRWYDRGGGALKKDGQSSGKQNWWAGARFASLSHPTRSGKWDRRRFPLPERHAARSLMGLEKQIPRYRRPEKVTAVH